MNLSELLTPELCLSPLRAADKWDAIAILAQRAVAAPGGPGEAAFDRVHEALVTRERSMTTGMENGVAIPHAAVDELDDPIAVLGIAPDGIDFEALDGLPAKIVVGLVIPRAKKLLHIKTLAGIAKLLSREDVRSAVVTAPPESVLDVVRDKERETP